MRHGVMDSGNKANHWLQRGALCSLLLLSAGCSSLAYTNVIKPTGNTTTSACDSRLAAPRVAATPSTRATLNFTAERGDPDTLFVLALSGGGSRAAYFGGNVMLRLQQLHGGKTDLLSQVDVMSSVSGGSLPAAYYAISSDPNEEHAHGRMWDEHTVKKLMSRNYISRWFGNWFWPSNIGKFWFTAYDRTDIMAQTLADNLFDVWPTGQDLKMSDLRKTRPYLILNATNGTRRSFGRSFTFTTEDFGLLDSDVGEYSLARAVMATATFPSVFNYMTLADFTTARPNKCQYTHVFDGGNYDNLGLNVVRDALTDPDKSVSYKKLIVVLVDAYTESGISQNKADPRAALDYLVDTNFLMATDALLTANRTRTLESFEQFLRHQDSELRHTVFYHLRFDDVTGTVIKKGKEIPLREALNGISTNFTISKQNTRYIDQALDQLMAPDNVCIQAIQALLNNQPSAAIESCAARMDYQRSMAE